MSFCQVCGTSLTEGSLTCHACGAVQGVAAAPGSIPGAIPPPPPPVYVQPAAVPGLTPNVAGALAYLVGAITGILFLVIDPFKTDRFVRSTHSSPSSSTWRGLRFGSCGAFWA